MGRACKICHHADKAAIDSLILARVPASEIMSRYNTLTSSFSEGSISRHRRHIGTQITASMSRHQKIEDAYGDSLVEQLKDLQRTTVSLLHSAVETDDRKSCAAFIRLAQENIEKQGKLTNQIPTPGNVTVNFYASPEWRVFWEVINRYQDVKLELIEELRRLPSSKFSVPSNTLAAGAGSPPS